jgi:leucyl aminopeptidase (aminopeptidase T)
MERASVILAVTVFSISHTQARLEASGRGARIASMPALDDEIFARSLPTDYALLERDGGRMAAALTAATTCRVSSPAGMDVVLDLDGRAAISDDGRLQATGAFGNLPAGEAFIAPVETGGEGSIVIDGALAGYGIPRPPLRLLVAAGRIVEASGGASRWLLETLDAGGESGRAIAELGIGTNPAAILSGSICEDEKVAGTAHIAFGTNASFGGTNVSTVHIDGVMLQPTVELDGRPVMRDGRATPSA